MEKESAYDAPLKQWVDLAKDYPTKALLVTALKVYQEQEARLDSQKSKLDGMMWSPEGWE